MISLKLLLKERFEEKNRSKLFKSNISEQTIKPPEPAVSTRVSPDYLYRPSQADLIGTTDPKPMSPEEEEKFFYDLSRVWKKDSILIDPYDGPKIRKSEWYERTDDNGEVTLDLPGDMHKMVGDFANAFSSAFVRDHPNLKDKSGKQKYIIPLITSAYRPPERQIDAVWAHYAAGDTSYPIQNYSAPFGNTIQTYFDKTTFPEKDKRYLSPEAAKNKAIEFLKSKESEGEYMSNHQTKGAIDMALTNKTEYNNWIHDYLTDLHNKKEIKYLDERSKTNPHFHVRISGDE